MGLEELVDNVSSHSLSQVFCKLRLIKTRFQQDDAEIRRMLQDSWSDYRKLQEKCYQPVAVAAAGPEQRVASKHGHHRISKLPRHKRQRRIWNQQEMEILRETLQNHGTSISAITRALKGQRTTQQVLMKLRAMKKEPGIHDPTILNIINSGRLSKKT